MFAPGRLYSRLHDIHEPYGGSRQSGISPSSSQPLIFLFTGASGDEYGYADHWDDDGQFVYCGEGQTGDMQFIRGNKAVLEHADDGRELHVFEALGSGKPVRYIGEFVCSGWHNEDTSDREGNIRSGIFFHLLPIERIDEEIRSKNDVGPGTIVVSSPIDLSSLRDKALAASLKPTASNTDEGRRTIYKRSAAVRDYVLARSEGICEGCKEPAPFRRSSGGPYLEPHHTRRVSDGGPDDPRWVIALCPNCHRRVHHGDDGAEYNNNLQMHLDAIEAE